MAHTFNNVLRSKSLRLEKLSRSKRCRVCLESGNIPIFGEGESNDLSNDVRIIGGINIVATDNYPKYLCQSCHKLLQAALLFKLIAQKSEEFLKLKYEKKSCRNVDNQMQQGDTREPSSIDSDQSSFDEDKYLDISEDETEQSLIDNCFNGEIMNNDIQEQNQCIKTDDENSCSNINNNTHVIDNINASVDTDNNEMYMVIISDTSRDQLDANDENNVYGPNDLNFVSYGDQAIPKKLSLLKKRKVSCSYSQKNNIKNDYKDHQKKCVKRNQEKSQVSLIKSAPQQTTTSELKITCEICNKEYKRGYMKMHMATHTGTKRFVCEKCGKSFTQQNALKTHELIHGTELAFQCELCPYRGRHKGLLRCHMRTHTREYNYECTECNARFITKSNLNKHVQRHKGPVNFICDICSRGFYSKSQLLGHIQVDHLGEKKHVCNICGKAFGYKNSMNTHQLKVHKRPKKTMGKGRIPLYLQFQKKEEQVASSTTTVVVASTSGY